MTSAPRLTPEAELVLALQMGDSAFPTGGFAYSWGMETLIADGLVSRKTLPAWARAELEGRWHGVDRIALAGGWRAQGGAELEAWDGVIDLHLWSEHQRVHSQQSGAATLAAAVRLDLPGAAAMRDSIAGNRMAGHCTVLTGALHAASGLRLETALLLSAQGFLRVLLSAAVRLGKAGALEVQAIMTRLAPEVLHLAEPPPPGALPCGFGPLSDIAQMRPRAGRLFVN